MYLLNVSDRIYGCNYISTKMITTNMDVFMKNTVFWVVRRVYQTAYIKPIQTIVLKNGRSEMLSHYGGVLKWAYPK